MKRLTEYSEEELLQLSEEEVKDLKDLECMCAGVPVVVTAPKYAEVPVLPEKDVDIYSIGGMHLTSREEADFLQNAIESLKTRVELDYDYDLGYDHKYTRGARESISREVHQAYSKERYSEAKHLLKLSKQAANTNARLRSEYEEKLKMRQEVEGKVDIAIQEACVHQAGLQHLRTVYSRYLELSNGDASVASNFFKANYPNLSVEDLMKVLEVEGEENGRSN